MKIFNNIIYWNKCTLKQRKNILTRPKISTSKEVSKIVNNILTKVKLKGDDALRVFSHKYDKKSAYNICINKLDIINASNRLSKKFKKAMDIAFNNINYFHKKQKIDMLDIETLNGVRCQQITRPIQSIGLYIPNGSAPLFSTVLMLAIPAKIAECKRIVICSPPIIFDEILYAASLCGIEEIFQIGGAQAIGALAFGTKTIKKVDKIFGPGNIYVTEAKKQVSQRFNNVSIDMPAGPSELLIIADQYAIPEFIASDLLSQAEHDPYSQVILITDSIIIAKKVILELNKQFKKLNRSNIIIQSLNHSKLIITCNIHQCIEISNEYGPEHLIIQTNNARKLVDNITTAGSIFLGPWSAESIGDYASGTNHVLPTYGYTSTISGLSLTDFQKKITVQELTPKGFMNLAKTVQVLSEAELLDAHKNSITLRVNSLRKKYEI